MTTPTILCVQCQQPITIAPGAYRIVGIQHTGRSWPSVYAHQGQCEQVWRAAHDPENRSEKAAKSDT